MFLIQSRLSTTLLSFTCTATMVLPCWSADTTLVMDPLITGCCRFVNATTAIITATAAAAITTGTTGGKVHLARSNSSVIGTCPGAYCGAGADACWPVFDGCGGLVFSGMATVPLA